MHPKTFLKNVGLLIHQQRPKVPESFNYTVWTEGKSDKQFVQLWFRTRGCKHSVLRGGCTMCDYWESNPVSSEKMILAVQEGLSKLVDEPATLLLNASGSIFDEWEVPKEARQEIFRLLSRFKKTSFIFETHIDTISERKVRECIDILNEHSIEIEFGLESSNPLVLKYCLNKSLILSKVSSAVSLLRENGIKSSANILIGAPFLTTSEVIEDALYTIHWAFDQGVDECVLFPVNLKPFTLTYWLYQNNMYTQPSLWTLVYILSKVETELLQSIYLAWVKPRPQLHPAYIHHNIAATTCPQCYPRVIELLDSFNDKIDKNDIIEKLTNICCKCKNSMENELVSKPILPLIDRIQESYSKISKQIPVKLLL